MMMADSLDLIRSLVAIPAPPGQEALAREFVMAQASALGYQTEVDPKGNLLVYSGKSPASPQVIVTAHLDEIALLTTEVMSDGRLKVTNLGGLYPWKWGEQPVEIWATDGAIPGAISFGSIHTESQSSVKARANSSGLTWEMATIFTGLSPSELVRKGARPGTRVTLARERRTVWQMGDHIAAYFLDDRADLAVWLMALERMQSLPENILFAATVSEEVGGLGARYLMSRFCPELCIALEIGPRVPESLIELDDQPTVWVKDSYAAMDVRDIELIASLSSNLGMSLHWQAFSRGGSDATCAAEMGAVARFITLGLPVENSHGLEIMHKNAPEQLANLLIGVISLFS